MPGVSPGLALTEAEPLHRQQVPVDVGLLVEVQGAGQVLQVRHVLKVRLAETQDGEPARHGMPAAAERDDLQGEVRHIGEAEQIAELIEQDLLASDRPSQRGFLDDRPELELAPR